MEEKRPRGRPRKVPEGDPIILSMGMEKVGKLYSTFILKTRGKEVIEKHNFQPDVKISSQLVLHDQIIWAFVNNEAF